MLEASYGLNFFLKSPKNKTIQIRYVYLRVTVDGIPKEISTKMKWDSRRWDQEAGRAIGTKEDAKTLNFYLEAVITKISQYKTDLINSGQSITATAIISFVNGESISKAKVLEEFQAHNDEMKALVEKKEFAKGTHTRYVTARSHVKDFILFKYKKDDLEFRELNYEFVVDYEFYLKTVRDCSNNTSLKYILNFKKIILRAIAKEIITKDPFTLFKGKKIKIKKYPLTKSELSLLESKSFSTERLTTIRDIFVFQCYTGLAYIDVYQLKKEDIKQGVDGRLWIMSSRQKTKSNTDIPLLPKAIEIMEKYKDDPVCIQRGSVLPVKSNQKMNEYLKEVAELSEIHCTLNTHKARRTFASTVTLNNGVPIHVVKELLGHSSVKQTEEYAITEHDAISKEMTGLTKRMYDENKDSFTFLLEQLGKELEALKTYHGTSDPILENKKLRELGEKLNTLKSHQSKAINQTSRSHGIVPDPLEIRNNERIAT
jgi:integrase